MSLNRKAECETKILKKKSHSIVNSFNRPKFVTATQQFDPINAPC